MNLNQVTVPSLDVEVSIAFYQKLGLRLMVRSLPQYARFECPKGEATFSVHLVESVPSDSGIAVYFEMEALDQQVDAMLQKGIVFESLPENKTWLWREARLKDPFNNCIILYYAGENRKNPPWRLPSL